MIYELLYCLEFRQRWVIDDDFGGIFSTLRAVLWKCLGEAYVRVVCNEKVPNVL